MENAAIRDEKEEWSLLFARVVKEDKKAASLRHLNQDGNGQKTTETAGGEEDEGGGNGADDPRPTPLLVLRLLREAQEERSLSVKVGAAVQQCSKTWVATAFVEVVLVVVILVAVRLCAFGTLWVNECGGVRRR